MKKLISISLCLVMMFLLMMSMFAESGDYQLQEEVSYQICKATKEEKIEELKEIRWRRYLDNSGGNAEVAFEDYANKCRKQRIGTGIVAVIVSMVFIDRYNSPQNEDQKALYQSSAIVFGTLGIFSFGTTSKQEKKLKEIQAMGNSQDRESMSRNNLEKFKGKGPLGFASSTLTGLFTILLLCL